MFWLSAVEWEDGEADLIAARNRKYHYVENNHDDQDPDANSQGCVVQDPGSLAVPLRPRLVPTIVGFTGLKVRIFFFF